MQTHKWSFEGHRDIFGRLGAYVPNTRQFITRWDYWENTNIWLPANHKLDHNKTPHKVKTQISYTIRFTPMRRQPPTGSKGVERRQNKHRSTCICFEASRTSHFFLSDNKARVDFQFACVCSLSPSTQACNIVCVLCVYVGWFLAVAGMVATWTVFG